MMEDDWLDEDVPKERAEALAPDGVTASEAPVFSEIASRVLNHDEMGFEQTALALEYDEEHREWSIKRTMPMSGRTRGMPSALARSSDLYLVLDCVGDEPDAIIEFRRKVERLVALKVSGTSAD